jgi:Zn-finger nucleic acid-binding protein
MAALRCPVCRVDLAPEPHGGVRFDRCPRCRGVAVNLAVVRQFAPANRVRELWINIPVGRAGAPCPSCRRPLLATPVACGERTIDVDVCRACQVLWFDADELAAFSPKRQAPRKSTEPLSPAATEAVVRAKMYAESLGEQAEEEARIVSAVLCGLFGGFPP